METNSIDDDDSNLLPSLDEQDDFFVSHTFNNPPPAPKKSKRNRNCRDMKELERSERIRAGGRLSPGSNPFKVLFKEPIPLARKRSRNFSFADLEETPLKGGKTVFNFVKPQTRSRSDFGLTRQRHKKRKFNPPKPRKFQMNVNVNSSHNIQPKNMSFGISLPMFTPVKFGIGHDNKEMENQQFCEESSKKIAFGDNLSDFNLDSDGIFDFSTEDIGSELDSLQNDDFF